MNEARLAIERAISKLINRFGKESDVIGELRAALAAIDKKEAKQVREPVAVETEAAVPAVAEVSTAASPEAEPPPETPARRMYGGRKK